MLNIKRLFSGMGIMLSLAALSSTSAAAAEQTAVFAGGCFWGVDAVFKHVRGVSEVESGYAGGNADSANYEQVSNGNTGHAEAVRVRFDPAKVSYRSAVFFTSAEQQKNAQS